MISKEKAFNQLLFGYIFAAIGFAIGASNDIYTNPIFSFFMVGYLFWSLYWGYLIVSKPIHDFFGKMIVIENNPIRFFLRHVIKQLVISGIIILFGVLVGALGGAIYKQIRLSVIAYK